EIAAGRSSWQMACWNTMVSAASPNAVRWPISNGLDWSRSNGSSRSHPLSTCTLNPNSHVQSCYSVWCNLATDFGNLLRLCTIRYPSFFLVFVFVSYNYRVDRVL